MTAVFRTTLRRLEVFVAAVEAGGFRACSDLLGISQAAVSNHIKHLENELGYPLFVRKTGSISGVTEQGATAYREAKELLEHASQIGHLNGGKLSMYPPQLSVRADQILDAHLAKHIARFIGGRPTMHVALECSHFEEIVGGINAGEVDIAYFYSSGPVREINSVLAWREPLSICASQGHAIFSDVPTTISGLRKYPFVAPPKGTHFRRSVDQVFRRNGLEDYEVALESGHANMAREAVINGIAISAVITKYLDEDLARHGVRRVDIAQVDLALDVRRATRRELASCREVSALTDFLDHEMGVPNNAAQ